MGVTNADTNLRTDYSVILWMVAIHLIALGGIFCFSWGNLLLALVGNFATGCVGITLTYHRLLTHRTYQVPKWFERILATFGIISLQGSPAVWVAHHRMHHAGSDTPKDPHNARNGFWYSHMGWLFRFDPQFDDQKEINRFARDILADPYYRWLEKIPNQMLVQALLGFVLWLIGGWPFVIWGIFVRLVIAYHSTWFVNSAAHIWGYKNYETDDTATNNWWVALLTWGEGWHNNHHAHQHLAEAGHKWWEYDVTFAIIRLFKALGLATKIKSKKLGSVPVTARTTTPTAVPTPLGQDL